MFQIDILLFLGHQKYHALPKSFWEISSRTMIISNTGNMGEKFKIWLNTEEPQSGFPFQNLPLGNRSLI